jgi:hypothetical protein
VRVGCKTVCVRLWGHKPAKRLSRLASLFGLSGHICFMEGVAQFVQTRGEQRPDES